MHLFLTFVNRAKISLCFVSDVACNKYLRRRLSDFAQKWGIQFFYPSPKLCTDNAGMILPVRRLVRRSFSIGGSFNVGWIDACKAQAGLYDDLDLGIF